MEWTSAIVGLGGLAVAALSVYLNYRPRSTYQERVYDRQLDAYGQIVRRLGQLHDEAMSVLAHDQGRLDDDKYELLRTRTREQASAFFEAYRDHSVFLTAAISDPIRQYLRTFRALSANDRPDLALNDAFDKVATAASQSLGVEPLSLETAALFGQTLRRSPQPPTHEDAFSVTLMANYWEEGFRDFRPENRTLRSGRIVTEPSDLPRMRDQIYEEQQNLFLFHTWRPSTLEGQLADISIRLKEHPSGKERLRDVRPLSDGLVERVEYFLGRSFFDGQTVIKTNAEEDFRLDVSAYGSTLCVARVHFRHGDSVVLKRYLDFPDVRSPDR
jgi:hypothetical protein